MAAIGATSAPWGVEQLAGPRRPAAAIAAEYRLADPHTRGMFRMRVQSGASGRMAHSSAPAERGPCDPRRRPASRVSDRPLIARPFRVCLKDDEEHV